MNRILPITYAWRGISGTIPAWSGKVLPCLATHRVGCPPVTGWRGLTGGVHVRHDGAGTREQGRPSGGRNWPGARALVVVVTGRLGDLLAGDGVDRQKDVLERWAGLSDSIFRW